MLLVSVNYSYRAGEQQMPIRVHCTVDFTHIEARDVLEVKREHNSLQN